MVLDKLGASRSSVFINLIPVVSVVASFIVLGERLAPPQLAEGPRRHRCLFGHQKLVGLGVVLRGKEFSPPRLVAEDRS
jgi:drug/metabolite transporter (DMT)-like permease